MIEYRNSTMDWTSTSKTDNSKTSSAILLGLLLAVAIVRYDQANNVRLSTWCDGDKLWSQKSSYTYTKFYYTIN